jgi:hypothetical protein
MQRQNDNQKEAKANGGIPVEHRQMRLPIPCQRIGRNPHGRAGECHEATGQQPHIPSNERDRNQIENRK